MTVHRILAGRRGTSAATALALATALVAGPASAATAAPRPATVHDHRGELLSVTTVADLTAPELTAILVQLPFDATNVRYDIRGYRISYRTIDTAGHPTTASALVVLPTAGPRRLPVIVYGHGTRVYRGGVASMTDLNGDREAAELFASAGFAAVAPDYLGLGTGPGYHPYVDVASEVTASLDALRAAAVLARQQGRELDGRVNITGFSQGGQMTMALGRALQEGADPRWRAAALAPISGPYDIQHAELPALLEHPGDGPGEVDPVEGAFYTAYWTVSANRRYHLYDTPDEVFQAPYADTVEALFDGYTDEDTIFAQLPDSPLRLLTPQYVQRLLNPQGQLLEALRDNDTTCQWRPRMPVRLYAASGDRDAPIANTVSCQRQLAAHGGYAKIVDEGQVDHVGSAIAAIPQVLAWFLHLDRAPDSHPGS